MAWVFVICAGIFEIVGVIGMNGVARAKTPRSFATLFIGFVFSFTLLNLSPSDPAHGGLLRGLDGNRRGWRDACRNAPF